MWRQFARDLREVALPLGIAGILLIVGVVYATWPAEAVPCEMVAAESVQRDT